MAASVVTAVVVIAATIVATIPLPPPHIACATLTRHRVAQMFSGAIASALTVEGLTAGINGPADLNDKVVATATGSTAAARGQVRESRGARGGAHGVSVTRARDACTQEYGATVTTFDDVRAAIDAMLQGVWRVVCGLPPPPPIAFCCCHCCHCSHCSHYCHCCHH